METYNTHDTSDRSLVVNGPRTYESAAYDLTLRGHVVLNWTDREGTALNILMCYAPTTVGDTCGVIDSGPAKLWVGVAGRGCFAFAIDGGYVDASYVAEKLRVNGTTATYVGTLIGNVRTAIAKADAE